jgi:hypothetical protein
MMSRGRRQVQKPSSCVMIGWICAAPVGQCMMSFSCLFPTLRSCALTALLVGLSQICGSLMKVANLLCAFIAVLWGLGLLRLCAYGYKNTGQRRNDSAVRICKLHAA